jgi:ubiquinone/menaquinone biosynthesis C-methylase UbiE
MPKRLKKTARFIEDALPALKKHRVKKVLDLGCGAGRHCILLAGSGFDVVGMDVSKHALKMASRWVQKEGLENVALIRATMTNVPIDNHCLDAVVSVSVMHHALKKDIMTSVNEVRRILGKNGWFVANLASVHDPRYGTGRKLEQNTFWIPEGYEKKQFGELHHFFTKREALRLLSHFSRVEVTSMEDKPNYWKIVAIATCSAD